MSVAEIAYLGLVIAGFGLFIVVLASGYVLTNLPERKATAAPKVAVVSKPETGRFPDLAA
jgi:hypothetical protein